jgi:4-carboxymuconolactone decarboxylase
MAKKTTKKTTKKTVTKTTKKSVKNTVRKAAAKRPSAKVLTARLPVIPEDKMSSAQRDLVAAISSGPRGAYRPQGPFAVFVQSPEYGNLAQQLGAHCRYKTVIPPRLSEFAILVTARLWKAQYEWFAHAPIAEKAGVKKQTIADLRAGRKPTKAAPDEKLVYAVIQELYATKRVSAANYAKIQKLFGDAGMVEFVGILGYYVLVAMSLNVFQMLPPAGEALAFPEK